MNRYAKEIAKIFLPKKVFTTIQSIRSRNYQMRLHKEWGVYEATKEMIDSYGLTVLHGPFRGMRYPKSSLLHRDGIPILFGTYELELHPIIEEVASNRYACIVDIGSAEGYYAVGLALRTKTRVYAFDCEPRERHYLRQMARLNAVSDLIQTEAWCNPRVLSDLAAGRRCLIISDCEGYEVDLFSEVSTQALKASDLIIELHDNRPGMNAYERLSQRFQSSHKSRVVTFDESNLGPSVPEKWKRFGREFRTPRQQWLYLNPLP
jgi:hypothetical protein